MSTTLAREWQAVIANMTARPWIQHQLQRGDAVCARGAVMTCEGLIPGDEHILWQVAYRQGLTEAWNDAAGRTKEQVVVWMRSVGVTDTDLELTFGPQWRRVVALVRRAARLTPEEIEAVEAAWAADARDDAWAAAWAADARAAAWAASAGAWRRGAAWASAARAAAARADAWDAAARDAAWDAAWAIAVSDLVGQHGLTQDHIDTLMQPWIAIVGPDWERVG
jgi:hypothetical protein